VNGRDSLAYDQAGRLAATREALSGAAYQLTYTYDIRDRLKTRSAPTGGNQVTYAYNGTTGVLDTLCAAAACVAFRKNGELLTDRRTYNPGLGGNWFHEKVFNASHTASSDSFSVATLDANYGTDWRYDSLGRMTGRDYSGHDLLPPSASSYWYDAVGRLTNRCAFTAGLCFNEYGEEGPAYVYDAAGNRIDPGTNPVIGPGNRTQSFKGYTLGYDANGNLTSKGGTGGTNTYTWDALGRLIEVRNGGVLIATYKYDPLGRRVAWIAADGTTERYVHDGDHVILDVTGTHVVKAEYGYEPGVDRLFAIKNTQGAAWTGVVISDPTIGTVQGIATVSGGTLKKGYGIGVWGNADPDTGVITRFRMAGREYDQATNLYYMRARYYDPDLGRFLSEDPLGIAGGLNLYAYAGNDPVNRRDPTGLDECPGNGIEDLHKEDPGKKGPQVFAASADCDEGSGGGGQPPPRRPRRCGHG
jgi:RHS repeat-associated protein